MSKRSNSNEEQESKRVRPEIPAGETLGTVEYSKLFFSGEQVDDVYIICKRWCGGSGMVEVYFKTRAMAEEFLELIKKRDRVDGDKYEVQMLRRAEGSDEKLCESLIMQRPLNLRPKD